MSRYHQCDTSSIHPKFTEIRVLLMTAVWFESTTIYRIFCRTCFFLGGGTACHPVFKAAALCHNRGWGQWTVMWYGWHARHSWHSWPDAWPSSQCYCSVSVCMCYWFNPEHSGEEEVSTQQFRHFHPETRTHLCLSVSWRIWFRLSLALPQPAITCSPCTCPHLAPFLLPRPATSIAVPLEPAGNPPAQPVLGALFQSMMITIIQQLSLH